jgi:hypothetical protein
MTLTGTIRGGVVILDGDVPLPEGTSVTVAVASHVPTSSPSTADKMSEEERQRVLAIGRQIAALAIEGSPEPCSGADHDKILYGSP